VCLVEVLSTARRRVQVLLWSSFGGGALACVLGAMLLAQGLGPSRAAFADEIGDAQSQAQQLAAQIAAQSARIHALTDQYDQAQLQEEVIAQQVQSARDGIQQTRDQIGASLSTLRRQAVAAYINGSSAPGSVSLLLSRDLDEAALREEYLSVANGDVHDTLDDLHTEQAALRAKEAQLEAAEQSAQSVVAGLAADRQALAGEAAQEEATLSQVQGRLATLVAQAEEQRLAAAAAAQQQAQARQAQQAQSQEDQTVPRQVATPPAPPAAPPGGGQPTQDGLATVASPPPAPGGAGGGGAGGGAGNAFYEIRQCESGGNYSEDTGNGYYGAYQISESTWESLGYSGLPSEASPATQDAAAAALQARSGWGQWPTCAAMLGLL
jgi:peptidoglycan hydrolase CwlO-like protein